MADHDVDLFVIGAGSGGVRAARIASSYGAKVMAAEEFRVGGTCVIRGCVPKKLLVYAARFAHDFEDAKGFGWSAEPTFSWQTLIANKDREITRLEAAYSSTLERFKVNVVKSRAVIEDAHTVRLATGARVRAETILIATGGWPHMGPNIPGLEHAISSNEALDLKELPQAHPDPGRRLHRARVRLHLRRPRQQGDGRLSRREHPARLRRRYPRASALRNAGARHHRHLWPDRRRDRAGRRRVPHDAVGRQHGGGRQGDVRHRPAPQYHGARLRKCRPAMPRAWRHRGRRIFAHRRCRTSMPSATSPTAST